jgi:archaellum biogenesis ATPase FlaH
MRDISTVKTGYLDLDERLRVRQGLESGGFKTGLRAFDHHGGFQRGELHTFVGGKGIGKSTMTRSIIAPLLNQGKDIILLISEERRSKYLYDLNNNMLRVCKTEEKLKSLMEHLLVVSELEMNPLNEDEVMDFIREILKESEAQMFIFDNFTTSHLSEVFINKQSSMLRGLKRIADQLDIPVLVFFHTSKMADPNLLNGDNVRGSATAINIGSYNYVMNQVYFEGELRNFLFVEKARYHSKSNKKFYEMKYNPQVGMFVDCNEYYVEDYKAMVSGAKKTKRGF